MEPSFIPKKRYCSRCQPLGLSGKHCCTLHPTADCWCATWSSTFPQISRWHNLDSHIRLSNENIRHAPTSAFANSGLELTPSLHSRSKGWSWIPRRWSLHNYWRWFWLCH